MRILQVNSSVVGGGAEKVAVDLFEAYQRMGHESYLAVGSLNSDPQPGIVEIPNDAFRNPWAHFWRTAQTRLTRRAAPRLSRVSGWTANLGEFHRWREWRKGIEDFNFPATAHLLELLPHVPDVLHLHNLHGAYFDLTALVNLTALVPTVLTLHDEWTFTGHCSYCFDCERWKTGCGRCPDLTIYPAIRHDSTAYNWERKRQIYSGGCLFVASPSRWLLEKARQSILSGAIVEARCIPHGIDLSIFRSAEKAQIRSALAIPQHAKVVLFAANQIRQNTRKDYKTIRSAFTRLSERLQCGGLILVALGEESPPEQIGKGGVVFVPFQKDPRKVAQYYQAADVFVHAARVDNFPNTVLEALACGTPVVATAVGGIPEQIEDGRTGFLVDAGDAERMAARLEDLLNNDELCRRFSNSAVESARQRFDLNRQTQDYLDWYHEIISSSGRTPDC